MSDTYEVHPVADLFPMLADDELAEMAADIKARGLLQPIVLDSDGRVLDGRNRLAACRIAGVDPDFITYEGDDPEGYALAVNVARRSLSKGQIAMIVELANQKLEQSVPINTKNKSWASVVHQFGEHDLAPQVVTGDLSLAEAYEQAQARKRAAEARRADMVRLKREAPDLYELAESGKLSHGEAVAALSDRERKAREDAERAAAEERARQTEEERKQRQARDEERAAVERDRERLRLVLQGWPTFHRLALDESDSDRAKAVMSSLATSERDSIAAILEQIGA